MRSEMRHRLRVAFFAVAASLCVGAVAADADAQPTTCAIRCAAPPEGCRYVGMVTTGPCNAVRCGRLICEEFCTVSCAAPPEGCHYENAMPTGPCDEVTCGQFVCGDGAPETL